MNRDEILAKAASTGTDEREIHIRLRAGTISKAIGVVIALLLVLIDTIWLDIPVIGWTALTISMGMNTIENWILVLWAKAKNELFWMLFDTAMLIVSLIMLVKAVS